MRAVALMPRCSETPTSVAASQHLSNNAKMSSAFPCRPITASTPSVETPGLADLQPRQLRVVLARHRRRLKLPHLQPLHSLQQSPLLCQLPPDEPPLLHQLLPRLAAHLAPLVHLRQQALLVALAGLQPRNLLHRALGEQVASMLAGGRLVVAECSGFGFCRLPRIGRCWLPPTSSCSASSFSRFTARIRSTSASSSRAASSRRSALRASCTTRDASRSRCMSLRRSCSAAARARCAISSSSWYRLARASSCAEVHARGGGQDSRSGSPAVGLAEG